MFNIQKILTCLCSGIYNWAQLIWYYHPKRHTIWPNTTNATNKQVSLPRIWFKCIFFFLLFIEGKFVSMYVANKRLNPMQKQIKELKQLHLDDVVRLTWLVALINTAVKIFAISLYDDQTLKKIKIKKIKIKKINERITRKPLEPSEIDYI